MDNQDSINEQEWAKTENWSDSTICLYFSKRDTRVRVPKRERELGWTFNLAHTAGAAWFVCLLLAPSAILLLVLVVVAARVR
jgi:uncharacterized membrane protein